MLTTCKKHQEVERSLRKAQVSEIFILGVLDGRTSRVIRRVF